MEDDILVNLVMAELEKENEPDPRRIQINLTGFLDRNAPSFVAELWKLLISAQENYLPGQKGIPTELLKEKIIEIDKLNKVIEFRKKKSSGDAIYLV
jgi:serine/arginine repetitive matrix protein 1